MGPTIILDKSAYQCLSRENTFELGRYFYVVVPPVLILEILADLKKPRHTPDQARSAVRQLARKIQPVDGFVNVDYRTLCTADLLGGNIKMDRRPMVAGARRVVADDGSVGAFLEVQPENVALIRWSCDRFEEAEEFLAKRWRDACEAIDLESFKRQLRSHVKWVPLGSLSLVRQVADELMDIPTAQHTLIGALLGEIRAIPVVREWTMSRWNNGDFRVLKDFAAYANHCARANVIFQLALVHGLIGTRSTNRIDMEYFYYAPFAHIFCSGDKLHVDLAEHMLDPDQSFVRSVDLRAALDEMVGLRISARAAGDRGPHLLEPPEGSLIRTLWVKHLGKGPCQARQSSTAMTEEKEKELIKKLNSFMSACDKAKKNWPRPPRWPCA